MTLYKTIHSFTVRTPKELKYLNLNLLLHEWMNYNTDQIKRIFSSWWRIKIEIVKPNKTEWVLLYRIICWGWQCSICPLESRSINSWDPNPIFYTRSLSKAFDKLLHHIQYISEKFNSTGLTKCFPISDRNDPSSVWQWVEFLRQT